MLPKLENLLLLLLLLLLPSQFGRHFWPSWSFVNGIRVDYLSPTIYLTDILILSILTIWLFRSFKTSKISHFKFTLLTSHISRHSLFLLLLLLLLLLSNLAFSLNQPVTLYKLLRFLEYSLFAFYLSKLTNLKSKITIPLSIAILWTSVLAISQFLKQASLGGTWYFLGERSFTASTPAIALGNYPDIFNFPFSIFNFVLRLRPYATFSHPNSLAGFLLIVLILIWHRKDRITQIAKILGSVTILLSASRVVILVGSSLLVLNILKKSKSHLIYLISACFFISTFYYSLLTISSPSQPLQERRFLNQGAIQLIRHYPLTGVGLGNFIPASISSNFQFSIFNFQLPYQPVHNIFLFLAAELGLPLIIMILYYLFIQLRKFMILDSWILFLAFLSILLTGMADHYWLTLHQNTLLLAVLFSFAWSSQAKKVKIKLAKKRYGQ